MVEQPELSLRDQDAIFRPHDRAGIALEDIERALDEAGFGPTRIAATDEESSSAENPPISGISLDSRTVREGDLYVALPGAKVHGAQFSTDALELGAAAILTDEAGAEQIGVPAVPVMVVEKLRSAIGIAASLIYGNGAHSAPSLLGVTGTNGKTTTTYFLDALLKRLASRTGVIGTIEIRMGEDNVPSRYTTPEATQLHALMARMRENQIEDVAMEVSSHAITYHRITGLKFRVAGFTNLTQDHLDLHGSMEEYFEAKAGLFRDERTGVSVITVNGGPEPHWGVKMAQAATSDVVTLDIGPAAEASPDTPLSAEDRGVIDNADWRITEITESGLGCRFSIAHRDGFTLTTRVGLPGLFNVANAALAAVMVLSATEPADWEKVAAVLEADEDSDEVLPFESAVPGRMEVVATKPATIVDFAHNPDGLRQALEAVARSRQDETSGRIIVVVGATGDRDKTKRPIMGAICAQGADVVVITDDDPHYEDPESVRAEILAGAVEEAEKQARQGREVTVVEVAPRQAALEYAVQIATPADTVLAAGRGHETAQDFAGTPVPLDDRVALRDALRDAQESQKDHG